MPRGQPNIQNFSPELFELLAKASRERITVTYPEKRLAVRARFRLYSLRKAMERTRHELFDAASQVTMRIYSDSDQAGKEIWKLELFPGDNDDILQAIRDAGVSVEVPGEAQLDESTSLEDYLGKLAGDDT